MVTLRLSCATFWVDVQLRDINGRWIASADTPDGPSLGLGLGAMDAIEAALEPFEGIVDALMASLADGAPLARHRPAALSQAVGESAQRLIGMLS
jgi:hypothetical protein